MVAFAKNYLALGFKLDHVRTDGDLSTDTPDFIVKADDGNVTIVETKGREELELPRRMARRAQWCIDATAASHAHDGLCTDSSMSIRKASTAIRQPAWLNW